MKKDKIKNEIIKNLDLNKFKESQKKLKKIGIDISINKMASGVLNILDNPKDMRNILRNK